MQSPHGSNIPSIVVNKRDKEDPQELERLHLNTLKAKGPRHSKRMSTFEIGSSSKSIKKVNKRSKVKDARELVASPEVVVGTLIENVDALPILSERKSTYELGSSSKSTKKVNKRSNVKDARELVVSPEVVEISPTPIENEFALSIHSKRKSTNEIGSSTKSTKKVNKRSKVKDDQELVALPEAVETQVKPIENVVTLPSQPNANKKHPRHRLHCLCIVCIQPASGSKHHVSCECRACVTLQSRGKKHSQKPPQRVASRRQGKGLPKPTLQIESSNASPPTTPNLAERGTLNHTHQTRMISRVSEDNGDANLSSMHSKILPFDLNFPPADFSDDF